MHVTNMHTFCQFYFSETRIHSTGWRKAQHHAHHSVYELHSFEGCYSKSLDFESPRHHISTEFFSFSPVLNFLLWSWLIPADILLRLAALLPSAVHQRVEYLTRELLNLVVHPGLALLSDIWNDFPFSVPKCVCVGEQRLLSLLILRKC